MGELDGKPFLKAAKRKFSDDEVNVKAVELCSQYEAYIRDPNWFPFKVLIDKEGKAKVQWLPELHVQISHIFYHKELVHVVILIAEITWLPHDPS